MAFVDVRRWVLGARLRTLPAAVVPVLVGTGVAQAQGGLVWWRAAAAMVVSLAIQVGTNYANDYSDGVRGTDTARVGPTRLVASGLASPKAVKVAALAAFGVAGLAGLALTVAVGPILLAVGAACMAAGWLYTGGPRPYGYAGFGELFVFVFFGLVATVGTVYVQTVRLTWLALVVAVPVGLFTVSLIVINNLRDIPSDRASGKHTLAVRLGDTRTRVLYEVCLYAPFLGVGVVALWRPWALVALAALVFTWPLSRAVIRGDQGPTLVAVLGGTGRVHLLYGALLTLGLVL